MKRIASILIFVSLLFAGMTEAQNLNRFPLLRERILQAKLREIHSSLNMDQATFVRFRPIYLRYEQEISDIDFRKIARLMRVNADSLTTEEADELIVDQLDAAQRLIEVRKKYYRQFRTVLTPQQIIKLYQTEAELRRKVLQELKQRRIDRESGGKLP